MAHENFLVTGCGSGIGAALARELLGRGKRVCAVDINLESMAPLQPLDTAGDWLWIRALDVRQASAWDSLVDEFIARWNSLDVLVNVAGVLRPGYCYESTAEDVDFQFDVNAKGVIHGTRAASRQMIRQDAGRGSGHIVNIASLAGVAPIPGLSLYSASKFAVRGYSLAAAYELRDRGVKVTVVCPDAVQTPMLDQQVAHEQAALTFSGPRSLSPEEVVAAVLDDALVHAPLEILLPRTRGWMSKIASLSPALAGLMLNSLKRRGRQRQSASPPPAAKPSGARR